MAPRGKKINVFFMDGDVSGRVKCTIDNKTIIAYRIPLTELDRCKDRDHLTKCSGVYFLFGNDLNDNEFIYIGQAGVRNENDTNKDGIVGILKRLFEHRSKADKGEEDEWNEAVVFVTANNSFGPTEISYLEHRFYKIAKDEINRYRVTNQNTPNKGNVIEEIECGLEDFIDDAKIIVGTLGYKVFVPISPHKLEFESRENDQSTTPVYELSSKGIHAEAMRTNEGFLVLAGSQISGDMAPSVYKGVTADREKYKELIVDNKLQKDILFKSPSRAASFILGYNKSGTQAWFDKATGKSIGDVESEFDTEYDEVQVTTDNSVDMDHGASS